MLSPTPSPAHLRLCRLVLADSSGAAFLYSITADELSQPPGFEGALDAAVWHSDDPNLLALMNDAGGRRRGGQGWQGRWVAPCAFRALEFFLLL